MVDQEGAHICRKLNPRGPCPTAMVDPIGTGLQVTILSLQAAVKNYNAYVEKKVMQTDQVVCQEVGRRVSAILARITIDHKKSHRDKNRSARRGYEELIRICNSFLEDIRMSITRPQDGSHMGISKPGKKSLEALVNHDLAVVNALEECKKNMHEIVYTGSETIVHNIDHFSLLIEGAKEKFRGREKIFQGCL